MKRNSLLAALLILVVAAISFESCEKEVNVSPTSISIYKGESQDVIITYSQDRVSGEIDNSFIASCFFRSKTETFFYTIPVTGKHVGNTYLRLTGGINVDIPIEVKAKYHTYVEPNLDFDDTRDLVKAKFGEPTLEDVPLNDTTKAYVYYINENNTMLVNFYTYNEKVGSYALSFSDESIFDELEPYLIERYEKFGETSTLKAFMNAESMEDATIIVSLSKSDSGYMVLYTNPETLMVPDKNDVSALMTRLELRNTYNGCFAKE
jgi:hypothetical protein